MLTTIIYAHPYDKSFNHAILETVTQKLKKQGQAYQVLDLYADNFNPVYKAEELALFSKGEAVDPLVQHYQKVLDKTNRLIFIFPIWWYDVPAIVKGFFDKVFLKTYAYQEEKSGLLTGLLSQIEEALVLTTAASPTWYLKLFGGNVVQKAVLSSTLKAVGIGKKSRKWFNVGRIARKTPEQRRAALNQIADLL
ncbi:NAD(P)H-dependent oxidoreductase [Streptococcus oricebi]|uniref:NAD(P)H dehydrogenase n=1 Tax=Streptococcus oricebi TaxID=1547447 RepID=A0ABS5B1L5_9STRE|nr:NAD(P)H-dependent oxidoreductase [Streptococcus oricebi]MBP2622726.1 NAD(P)H dehydrogenase [Streptococcus oricebi]